MKRRGFIVAVGAGLAGALGWRLHGPEASGAGALRPPGALPEPEFVRACIRCGLCAGICPRQCIELAGVTAPPEEIGLPQIDARQRACNLCMRCTEVCPTAALTAIPEDKTVVLETVSMGLAVVDEGLCISFLGRLCGLCRDACPYPGVAIKLEPWARPLVIADKCVGCGLCVERCPQLPTAIRIDPTRRRVTGSKS